MAAGSVAGSLSAHISETSCVDNSMVIGLGTMLLVTVGRLSITGKSRSSLKFGVISGVSLLTVTFTACKYYKNKQNEAIQRFYGRQRKEQEEKVLRMYGKKNVEAYEKLFVDARMKEEKERS